jgi:hypothetical protein
MSWRQAGEFLRLVKPATPCTGQSYQLALAPECLPNPHTSRLLACAKCTSTANAKLPRDLLPASGC